MKKRKIRKYQNGFLVENANGIGAAAGMLGSTLDAFATPNKANVGLTAGKGALSGLAAGSALGPIGMGVGALLGGGLGLITGNKEKKALNAAKAAGFKATQTGVFNGMTDTNVNPYGTQIFADGGKVDATARKQWNGYVDYLESKGFKGSTDLDNRDKGLSKKLFNEYATANKLPLDYDTFVPAIQSEIASYRNEAINQIKAGKATVGGKPYVEGMNLDGFMQGLSNVDGWAGSKTTSWKFPSDMIQDKATAKAMGRNTVYSKMADGGNVDLLKKAYKNTKPMTKESRAKEIANGSPWSIQDYRKFGLGEPGLETPPVDPIDIITGAAEMKALGGAATAYRAASRVSGNGFIQMLKPAAVAAKKAAFTKAAAALGADLMNLSFGQDNNYTTGAYAKYADGSDVEDNVINIEKGEMQIDPQSGKILRKYTGINPETGGLYQPHSKGKDTKNNLVTADEGTFIITKSKSKEYQDAIDNNDKLHRESILMNIKNNKDAKEGTKFKYGSYVKYADGGPYNPWWMQDLPRANTPFNMPTQLNPLGSVGVTGFSKPASTLPIRTSKSFGSNPITSTQAPNSIFSTAMNYLPAVGNIIQGIAGKVQQQPYAAPITNPYRKEILANMPQDMDVSPMINEMYLNNQVAGRDIYNNTNSAGVYRANRQQLASNLNRSVAGVRFQGRQMNNQFATQRASIYSGLAQQDMSEQARQQQYNFNVDQLNEQNRAAKSNMLNTGISQIQQTFMNDKLNNRKKSLDEMQVALLREIFPNLRYYPGLFNTGKNGNK